MKEGCHTAPILTRPVDAQVVQCTTNSSSKDGTTLVRSYRVCGDVEELGLGASVVDGIDDSSPCCACKASCCLSNAADLMGRILGLHSTGIPLCASAITRPDVGNTSRGRTRWQQWVGWWWVGVVGVTVDEWIEVQ